MFDIRKIQEQVIFSAVKAMSNDETATQIVFGENNLYKLEEANATWVKNTMKRLENHFDKSTIRQIRMNCQCGYGLGEKLKLVKELFDLSSNLEDFASQDKARAAGLSYANGKLYLQFSACPCPMLADVEKLDTDTWCQCTTGYSKCLFEQVFGCEVMVDLLKSIKMGDDICLMEIIPYKTTWK